MERISAVAPFDSSVGRAEDCRCPTTVILRSLVQFRIEGHAELLCTEALLANSINPFKAIGECSYWRDSAALHLLWEGLVAQWITRLTTDQKILGSTPG